LNQQCPTIIHTTILTTQGMFFLILDIIHHTLHYIHMPTPYYSTLAAESALRRSRIEADIVESRLRRSRVEAELVTESALRRSRI
jgi:hypothetical protein